MVTTSVDRRVAGVGHSARRHRISMDDAVRFGERMASFRMSTILGSRETSLSTMHCSRGTVWAVLLGCAACQPASDTKGATPAAVAARESRAAVSSATGSLDIASWNIEWFGDAGNGPSNESQQEQNARDVIVGADAEIWGVAEIVDEAQWSRLKSDLPAYDGVLASARAVTGRGNAYSATEQKVGIDRTHHKQKQPGAPSHRPQKVQMISAE